MDFNKVMASRAELEATIQEIQGKVTDLWRINHQQEEKIKDLEKQNQDRNIVFEATQTRLTRTEIVVRALEAKIKLQKAQNEDLKDAVSELEIENLAQVVKICDLEKTKSSEGLGVKANFSFLQSKLVRAESEYKDKIEELNSKNLKQKTKMRDCIKELQGRNEDQEAEIQTLKDHLSDKENLISKLLGASQTKNSSWETLSQRLALLETQVETLEAEKLRQESRSEELEMRYSAETFRREQLQKQLKLNQYDVDQIHEIAQSLEFHFNSTYVRFSGDNKLFTKAELEEAYNEAQRLQEKRRGLALARRMRLQEEEDRDR
ncbi:hypothetical protein FGADI_5964 [Fusarium gaditjirri]|uniref:Uncharacterized protein n=1 Tax=Fusarium gaditjirri TaxID=282569 RepID=A0A8H4WWQ3_9HYPO|nr:hypothetical protein FGADI_5964 [Fusarium gaditjirri]